MSVKSVLIRCQPTMLDLIKENDLYWTYSNQFGKDEIDVIVTDDADLDDEELVETIGLDYDQVNCIEAL